MANEVKIPTLTTEQIQLSMRLESIFMPYSTRQRDVFYKEVAGVRTGGRFVHYTSADAALKIIGTKRMWMRNTTCMSDYREVQHGFDILRRFFADPAKADKRKLFEDTLDLCAPGAAKEAIALFDQWWGNTQANTFITSISEHADSEDLHGRLSMWRALGGTSARVAIVFKLPWMSGAGIALSLMFSPVAYLTEEEAHSVVLEVTENIKNQCDFLRSIDRKMIVGMVFTMLLASVTGLKHEGFREEREWRAIYSPIRQPSPLMESSTEFVNGVPQLVHKIPLDGNASPHLADLDLAKVFDRLILGPSQFSLAMYQAFVPALVAAGVTDAANRVFISNIPIRT
jgi:hypothetical protein